MKTKQRHSKQLHLLWTSHAFAGYQIIYRGLITDVSKKFIERVVRVRYICFATSGYRYSGKINKAGRMIINLLMLKQ